MYIDLKDVAKKMNLKDTVFDERLCFQGFPRKTLIL